MNDEPAEQPRENPLHSFTFDLSIEIEGPVITAGIGHPVFGIDDTNLLGGETMTPVLPESLVRGNVVHVLREMITAMNGADKKNADGLKDLHAIAGWLGSGSDKPGADAQAGEPADDAAEEDRKSTADTNIPYRRKILFSDFELQGNPKSRCITRIALDGETGSVKHGSLQVLESPLDYGEPGTFQGTVTLLLGKEDAETARKWITCALHCVPAFGAHKGSGFGRNAGVSASEIKASEPANSIELPKIDEETQRLGFALTLDRPFLVNAQSISANQFKGSIDIPGAVIKGALAEMLIAAGNYDSVANALDKLVFRHAKPAKVADIACRPRAIPLSLYQADKKLQDALANCPVEAGCKGAYVEFQGDWKDEDKADASSLYGQTFEAVYDIRTRTAISETGTSEDQKLFTHMTIVPGDHVWVGEIARPDGVNLADFKTIVQAMAAGVIGIGKTRANAAVKWFEPLQPRTAEAPAATSGKETWRLVLETDAILHCPGDERKTLAEHYRTYFENILDAKPDTISLRFYASQRWVGGYQARRFPLYPDRYVPQLITEAGSVFELTAPIGLGAKFEALARFGLPLPKTIGEGRNCKFQYQRSAFNPENGYGEVTVEARPLTERAVPECEDC